MVTSTDIHSATPTPSRAEQEPLLPENAPARRTQRHDAQDAGLAIAAQPAAENAEFLRSLLAQSADSIAAIDGAGAILYITPHGPRLFGAKPAETLMGRPWLSLWSDACADLLRGPLDQALQGTPGRCEVGCDDRHGRPGWWEISLSPTPPDRAASQPWERHCRVVAVAHDVTEQHLAAERLELLSRELDHRVLNMMTMLQAIVRIGAACSTDFASFTDSLEARIHALARTHRLLAAGNHGEVDVRALLCAELEPFDGAGQLAFDGPAVSVAQPRASALALAIHELATNAVKYGPLSGTGGQLRVHWRLDGAELRLEWQEHSTTAVLVPNHSGFGSMLLETLLADQLTVERTWHQFGVAATINMAVMSPAQH